MGLMDFIRNPLTYHPDYSGSGSAQTQYAKQRADLISSAPATAALPSLPASTQNAVATTNAMLPGEDGAGRGYPKAPAPSVAVAAPGPAPVRDNTPYPTYNVDMTNAQRSSPAMSGGFPSIQFNAPPAAVAAGAARVGGVGVLPPEFHSQIGEMLDAARPLLNSAGIVDRLRGRQLLGQRDRLIKGAATIVGARTAGINAETGQANADANMLGAQTGAYRATNEVPLAMLGHATQKYGYDSSALTSLENNRLTNATNRYHTDAAVGAQNYATDIHGALGAPLAQRAQMVNDLFTSGQGDKAEEAASLGFRPQRALPEHDWKVGGDGMSMTRLDASGNTQVMTNDPKKGRAIVTYDKDGNVVKAPPNVGLVRAGAQQY